MATRDWALVAFTLLTQAAVGAFLTLQVLELLAGRRHAHGGSTAAGTPAKGTRGPGSGADGTPGASSGSDGAKAGGGAGGALLGGKGRGMLAAHVSVLAVLSVGLFTALFHLSTPLQAASAVVNFSSSWLSREIVFGSLFAILLAVLAATEWRAAGAGRAGGATGPNRWLSWLTAVAGVAFLYCQTAIYLLPAQPAWNSFATPAAFGGSALRLGILGVAAGLVLQGLPAEADRSEADSSASSGPSSWGPISWQAVRGLALAAVVVLGAELIVLPFHLLSLAADGSPAAAASAARLTGDYGGILLLRVVLLCVAAAALVGVLAGDRLLASARLARPLTGAAFCLVLVSELCGRFLFYAMQVRVGI